MIEREEIKEQNEIENYQRGSAEKNDKSLRI